MNDKNRVIPLDLLIDYPEDRYKAAVLAIKAIRNAVQDGNYQDIDQKYTKVAGYALKKVLEGEYKEIKQQPEETVE